MHIEHNMDNVVDLRVHIAPVGYEEDRIVIPAVQKKADRVWLLVHSNPSEDRALQFTERITKKLENPLPRYTVGTDAAMFDEAKRGKTDIEFENYVKSQLFT